MKPYLPIILFSIAILFSVNSYGQLIPQITEIPSYLNPQQQELFFKRNSVLVRQQDTLVSHAIKLKVKCGKVSSSDIKLNEECKTEQSQVQKEKELLIFSIEDYNNDLEIIRITKALHDYAKLPKWSSEEKMRIDSALNNLEIDVKQSSSDIRESWRKIFLRGQNEELSKEASLGSGPGFPGAGMQSHYDCAIYALANATGLNYSSVATLAAKIIGEGDWRNDDERKHLQTTLENGLNGGEVILIAESLGQMELIASKDFTKTLKDGHPILINVVPSNGRLNLGHEIVLTKTFQHNGETWYEMVNSNQKGTWQRLYLSNEELHTMVKENGVSYRPDTGTVPQIMR